MSFPYPPKQVNLVINKGTTFRFFQEILDTTTNLPFDLTGFSARFEARELYARTLVLSQVFPWCDEGGVHLELTPEDSLNLTWDRATYFIQVTDRVTGQVTTVFEGFVLVK